MVLRDLLVLEVAHLELGADIESLSKLGISNFGFFTGNESKDGWSINVTSASVDDSIADLSDKNNKSSWSVIILRVSPDEENGVHNWLENINQIGKFLSLIGKLVEEIHKSFKISEVLIRLRSGDLNFLLELAKWTSIGRFVLLKELQDLLDSLRAQLLINSVKI